MAREVLFDYPPNDSTVYGTTEFIYTWGFVEELDATTATASISPSGSAVGPLEVPDDTVGWAFRLEDLTVGNTYTVSVTVEDEGGGNATTESRTFTLAASFQKKAP